MRVTHPLLTSHAVMIKKIKFLEGYYIFFNVTIGTMFIQKIHLNIKIIFDSSLNVTKPTNSGEGKRRVSYYGSIWKKERKKSSDIVILYKYIVVKRVWETL